MSSETADYLKRRAMQVKYQLSHLRGQIAPLEKEWADLETALNIFGLDVSDVPTTQCPASLDPLPLNHLTIKQMIMSALQNSFESVGATPAELRDYIRSVYDRTVDRNSISPQLTRLRDDGHIANCGHKWLLRRVGPPAASPSSESAKT